MKDLKTYLLEAIKPPRLSAKNKHLWKQPSKEEIMDWLKENTNISSGIAVVDDGKIYVTGNVVIREHVKSIPYPFDIVNGNFRCNFSNIESLNNCPKTVIGMFDCSNCSKLTSLEGAPEMVGSGFYCYNCKNIKSLKGAPKEVGGNFFCNNCGKEFTEDDVRRVCEVGESVNPF